ncbi:MAG TPA: LysR family transcriptional regulator [Woeseiaceae bacterium]|nr:LysR family transcriptional regulator [Woeseiaceae bacterium]
MRLRHIEVFHAVYTTGSVTLAAKLLSISQPAVSKMLSHAEGQLGFGLFDRVKGRLVPTPEAHQLFQQAANVYDCLGQFRELSQNLNVGSAGNIRFSVTPAFSQEIVPRTIKAFLHDQPNVHVAVNTRHCSEVANGLINRQIEFGVVFERAAVPGLVEQVLCSAEFVVLSPKGWLSESRERLSPSVLADIPFVRLNDRGPLGQLLRGHLDQTAVRWNTIATVGTYHIAKSLVVQGAGVSIVDEVTARSNGLDGVDLHFLEPALSFKIKALWPESVPLSAPSKALLLSFKSELESMLSRKTS